MKSTVEGIAARQQVLRDGRERAHEVARIDEVSSPLTFIATTLCNLRSRREAVNISLGTAGPRGYLSSARTLVSNMLGLALIPTLAKASRLRLIPSSSIANRPFESAINGICVL